MEQTDKKEAINMMNAEITGFCTKCKKSQPMVEYGETTLKNGRTALKGKCSVCSSPVFTFKKTEIIDSGPKQSTIAKIKAIGSARDVEVHQEFEPFTTRINFKRVKCLIGPEVGNTLFVVYQRVVSVKKDKFTIGDTTFHLDISKTAYVAKTLFRGAMPHLLYDISKADPLVKNVSPLDPRNKAALNVSSRSFNTMFKKNIILQGLAALRNPGLGTGALLALVIGIMAFVMGYFVGIVFPVGIGGTPPPTTSHFGNASGIILDKLLK